VVDCTGVVELIRQAMETISPGGIICLTGVGSPTAPDRVSAAALATDMVLKNVVLFGSVNANRRHYYRAAKVLAAADQSWLEQLVTRRARPEQAQQALQRAPDDIKVIVEFAQP
jgi:threonine dehydrogenase-like Zn-dependent dehydrogenase